MGLEDRMRAQHERMQAGVEQRREKIAAYDNIGGYPMPRGLDLPGMTREQHLEVVAVIYDKVFVPGQKAMSMDGREWWATRAQLHATMAITAPSVPGSVWLQPQQAQPQQPSAAYGQPQQSYPYPSEVPPPYPHR